MAKIDIDFCYAGNLCSTLNIEKFEFNKSDIIFLYGQSGCGKTTLLNLVSGVIKSQTVDIVRSEYKSIAYVMHESTLLPWHKLKDNIRVEERLRKSSFNWNKFNYLCNEFSLPHEVATLKPFTLSLGMRQRVEIAKALSFSCDLLILDEALSGIDKDTKLKVINAINAEVNTNNICVIATAHQINDVMMLAKTIYIMGNGRIENKIEVDSSYEKRLEFFEYDLIMMGKFMRNENL